MKYAITILTIMVVLLILRSGAALADGDIDHHRECKQCGMDRKQYGYSRMLVTYSDGTTSGTCSLHCVITDLEVNRGKQVATIQVADRDNRKLINATTARWVIGGSKRGVMTPRAKWAFADKSAAEKFIADYGGIVAKWDEVREAARQDAMLKARK